ncbi:hypothetical protein [Bradyrhizobium sp.]|uniref:hypothetical protein n=1 Tax=Bradyrhizobium sp. TaxID=376 RepID=UPI0026075B10|nr:hypothetical protein [Bradyrhizobium sp.]
MIIRASGRSALIAAAGLLVLLASPVKATDGGDSAAGATPDSHAAAPATLQKTTKHAWHHRGHSAHRRLHTIAKSDDDKNVDDKKVEDKKAIVTGVATTTGDNRPLADIPPSIANANAQMLLAGVQISAAAAIPPGTDVPPTTTDTASADNGTVVVASDQLNDIDRTLQEGTSTVAMAASSPPPSATTMTGQSSAWDQTSLIGKIFIGFGALLTMASAARMFIT